MADSQKPHLSWWPLAIGAILLLVLFVLARLWPSEPELLEVVTVKRWADLPNLQPLLHTIDPDQTIHVGVEQRDLIFGDWPGKAVRSLEIEFTPATPGPLDRVLLLYLEEGSYWLPTVQHDQSKVGECFDSLENYDGNIRRDILPPMVDWDGACVCLHWIPRDPVIWLKLHWPGAAEWRLQEIRVVLQPRSTFGLFRYWPLLFKILLFTTAIGLLGYGAWSIFGFAEPRWKLWLLCLVGAGQVLVALLLPPFQGPDENAHWRAALLPPFQKRDQHSPRSPVLEWLWRTEEREPLLVRLTEVTGALRPRWRADIPIRPAHVRQPGIVPPEGNHVTVGYATPLTYPYVTFVALFFPRVTSVPEALVFFYLCRLMPIPMWMALLMWAERRGWLTFSLLTFLGLPLVLQQSVVISSDTIVLQGTMAAGLLFLDYRRQAAWTPLIALWVVSILVFMAKPPLPLPLLPVFLLPWRRLPWKVMTIPVLAVATLGLGWFVAMQGIALVERSADKDLAGKLSGRLRHVMTPEGGSNFAYQVLNRFTWSTEAFYEWTEPLGWLDTPLVPWHRLLIAASILLAVAADFVERLPKWSRRVTAEPWSVVTSWGLVVVFALSLVFGFALIMYLAHTATEKGESGLVGMQVRYAYPAVILVCLLPLAPQPGSRLEHSGTSLVSLFALPLGVLFLVRQAALAMDIVVRYFG